MPRLVLLEDDGREVFRGDISPEIYRWLCRFVARLDGGSMRSIAAAIRAAKALLAAAPPEPRRVTAGRKRAGRA